MREFEKQFSFSLSEEIMPDISRIKGMEEQNKFALIFDTGESITAAEIAEIVARTSLYPTFFVISRICDTEVLRSYSRKLKAPIVRPKEPYELIRRLAECAFSVSEGVIGSLFSIISRTPCYINAGDRDCRNFIGRLCDMKIPEGIIIPYTKNRTAKIRRPEVSVSDFCFAIKTLSRTGEFIY